VNYAPTVCGSTPQRQISSAEWGAEELLPRAEGANIGRNNAAEWLQDRRDMMKWWANYLDRKAKLAIAA
jgi:hypothetical protein